MIEDLFRIILFLLALCVFLVYIIDKIPEPTDCPLITVELEK